MLLVEHSLLDHVNHMLILVFNMLLILFQQTDICHLNINSNFYCIFLYIILETVGEGYIFFTVGYTHLGHTSESQNSHSHVGKL